MNPYEIRLELLKLAYDVLNQEFQALRQKEDLEWTEKNETFREGKTKTFPEYNLPKCITSEDIIRVADSLNSFVSKGN